MIFIKAKRSVPVVLSCVGVLSAARGVRAEHPQILVRPADRSAIQAKVEQAPWARGGFAALKARIDPLVEKTAQDPTFLTSRLPMNWDTHYTTTLVEKSRTVGGEGKAPAPTPRFEGARDWATDYGFPANIEEWKPYNDQGGRIYLLNRKTGQMEWVEPGRTGGSIRGAQQRMMGLAADAAFLYWITGDERYARLGSDLLWAFMEGFAYMQPPKAVTPNEGMMRIIGPTTFEVIHENVVIPVALAYDFLYPYLVKQGKDVRLIQDGLKRWAQRVTEGGGREGNWNLNQAMMIAYAGLALEDNAAYEDAKGRQHYRDVVLNADLPAQKGITRASKRASTPNRRCGPKRPATVSAPWRRSSSWLL